MGKLIIGIDPGKNGGLALMSESFIVIESRKMSETCVDLRDTIEDYKMQGAEVAYLEQVHAMPTDGKVGLFSFGQGFGRLQQVLADSRLRTVEVSPGTWQKALGLTKKKGDTSDHKKALKARAQQLFPDIKVTNYNQDALLIAYYGLKKENGL